MCCCCWKMFNFKSDWLKCCALSSLAISTSPTTSTSLLVLSQLMDESSPEELSSIPAIKLQLEASWVALPEPPPLPKRNLLPCLLPPADWPDNLLRCWVSHSARRLAMSTWMPLSASFFCCFSKDLSSFFSLRSRSFRSNSSAGIGSPEQVCGWALWAGRPGPFFVCSFLRHLARRFWNHTYFIRRSNNYSNLNKNNLSIVGQHLVFAFQFSTRTLILLIANVELTNLNMQSRLVSRWDKFRPDGT